ncbi:hypothetical protein Tco_0331718 [Tanacetum coccineum]
MSPNFKALGDATTMLCSKSIPCSPKCKIVGQILLDHPLSNALTSIVDVPVVGLAIKKNNVIQYPRFTKLIIADLMKKYRFIPKRLEDNYHSIKDNIPLVSVYSTGNVLFRGMLIPDAFLTDEIRVTADYAEYETVVKVAVPINQPQLVVYTQGTHKTTPRAHRTPTLTAASPQRKKRKQSAGETSSLRKSLKVTIKQKANATSIPPLSDDRERDDIAEATLLNLTLHKTSVATEAQENVAKVQEKLAEEEIEKMIEGKKAEESYASEFADSMLNDDKDDKKGEDEEKDDDVEKMDDVVEEKDNDDYTDHPLVGTHATDEHHKDADPPEGEKMAKRYFGNYSIEAHDPYSIVDKPDTGLIYLNSKNEKRVMYLVEIVKFCDATLEKVLKEVKLRIFQTELWKKPPLLGELNLDIMKAYKREITKRLRHREQIRRWESFVNGRPILPTMKRL